MDSASLELIMFQYLDRLFRVGWDWDEDIDEPDNVGFVAVIVVGAATLLDMTSVFAISMPADENSG